MIALPLLLPLPLLPILPFNSCFCSEGANGLGSETPLPSPTLYISLPLSRGRCSRLPVPPPASQAGARWSRRVPTGWSGSGAGQGRAGGAFGPRLLLPSLPAALSSRTGGFCTGSWWHGFCTPGGFERGAFWTRVWLLFDYYCLARRLHYPCLLRCLPPGGLGRIFLDPCLAPLFYLAWLLHPSPPAALSSSGGF